MLNHLKKIFPLTLSLLIFGAGFVYLNFNHNKISKPELQMSPKNFLYLEKYGSPVEYGYNDISYSENITNVRVNLRTGVSEPVIKVNPLDENILVISSNDFSIENNNARIFLSENYGATWNPKSIKLSDNYNASSYTDPWIEFNSSGILYYTAIQYDLYKIKKEGVFFARSEDNGKTWNENHFLISENTKVQVFVDKPKIFISKNNSIYLYWTEISGLNSYINLAVSRDYGNSFTEPARIAGSKSDFAQLTEDNNGVIYLIFLENKENISILKTENIRQDWKNTGFLFKMSDQENNIEHEKLLKSGTNPGIRINPGPSVCMSSEGDILISYSAKGNENDKSEIYFIRFSKETNKCTLPVRVNNDKTGNDQFMPVMKSDKMGNIFIFYQDSRNDLNNELTESYVSVSKDGGKHFTDHLLSTKPYSPSASAVEEYFGDYNSFVLTDNDLFAVWTDGRNNNFDLYTGKVSIDHLLNH